MTHHKNITTSSRAKVSTGCLYDSSQVPPTQHGGFFLGEADTIFSQSYHFPLDKEQQSSRFALGSIKSACGMQIKEIRCQKDLKKEENLLTCTGNKIHGIHN